MNGETLPPGFGDGWLSVNARDLVRIAVFFGGFPARELVKRLTLASRPGRVSNTRTVERVLSEMYDEARS